MSDVRPAAAPASPFTAAVARFEEAWKSGVEPSVETFLSAAGPLGDIASSNAELARELVLIDLEFRWRKHRATDVAPVGELPALPRSEDYTSRFPHLFAEPSQVAKLVAEEYWVRYRWGDRPQLSELAERYPGRVDVLKAAEQVVREVLRETALHRSEVELAENAGAPFFRDAAIEAAEVASPALGASWGRYVVAQLLGSGRFGSVYRCYDPQLNRFVALKVVRSVPHGGDHREAALREARAAASIRHPSVVAVFDVIENERNEVGIVTEFVAGEALEQYLGRGEPELVETLAWTTAIAEAIHAAHSAGVVHRDLKPANILIDSAGRPRVTDFGLALVLAERGAAAGEIAGTPRFMSPEQLRGDSKRVDGRSDVWSLGVILYRLLTGRFPFNEADPASLFRAIEKDAPIAPSRLSAHIAPQLEAICLRCLEKEPNRRWSSAAELAAALTDFQRAVGLALGDPNLDGVSKRSADPPHGRAASLLPRTSFELIGRDDELVRTEQAIAAPGTWLVTLCGPGGVGKTRLAVEAARRIPAPPGGVWWVDWSAARSATSAAQSVLVTLQGRLPEGASPEEHVSQVFRCLPPALVVLDNAEQLTDDAAELLERWNRSAAHVRFLVTSRRRLNLPGERLIELEPLGVPSADDDPVTSAGVRLFVRAAQETDPDLPWDMAQLRLAGEICRTLEGLPLGIELAARRVGVLSLAEINESLHERILSAHGEAYDPADRRRSLTAAVAWSFDLLTLAERTTLIRLSRFAGGFTRRTAAAMLRATPEFDPERFVDILQSLREKSLLRVRDTSYGRRFSMLQMIRRYGERHSAQTDDSATSAALAESLAVALTTELTALRPQLTTSTAAAVLERFVDERENLAFVERWALAARRHDVAVQALLPLVDALPVQGAASDLALRLNGASFGMSDAATDDTRRAWAIEGKLAVARVLRFNGKWHGAFAAAQEVAEALADPGPHARAAVEALRLAAEMQRRLGAPHDAEATLRCAEQSATDVGPVEQALLQLEWSVLLTQRGALAEAGSRLDQAAELLADGAAPTLEAEVERRRGQLLLQAGDPRRALVRLEQAAAASRDAGDLRALQLSLSSRGAVYVDLGRYDEALADFIEAERLARRLGDRRGLAVVWGNRAIALADVGDHPAALESFRRAERWNREIDAKFGIAANLVGQADVLTKDGEFAAALTKLEEASQLADASGFEFLAAVIQGDRGVAQFCAGDFSAARSNLATALRRLEAAGSSKTQEAFCYSAFAAAAERAVGNEAAARSFAESAQRLVALGVVAAEHPKPRVRQAFQLLGG